ncbi:MAG: class I adenylate-forming enzyme family protein [Spirochaetota bacterium]
MTVKTNFEIFYKKLLSGPDNPDDEFIVSGNSYKSIYGLACGIVNIAQKFNTGTLCLCTENKALIAAALLSSLGGGPLVLLPHSFNKTILAEMKDSENFDFVLSDMPEIKQSGFKVLTPDEIEEAKSGENYFSKRLDPDSVFLKLFTGGSTGKPKIWQKTPRNIFSEALYHSSAFNVTEKDIFISTVPPQHIYGLLHSVIVPFISSAKTTAGIFSFPQEIISSIKKYSATVLVSVPIHYRILKGNTFSFPSLRLAISSAGTLDINDAKYFFNETGIKVAEIFGSTETGGIAIRHNSGEEMQWAPFDNIEWKIQDSRLCVRSEFTSPDLPKDKDGFFATEDRIESADNSTFAHLGRSDGIVKVAGKRVDLREIENKLKRIPGVADVIAIALPASGGRENEIAAIVEGTIDLPGLKQSAKEILEPFALPRRIKIVDKMPILSTGKYDRQKIESILKS